MLQKCQSPSIQNLRLRKVPVTFALKVTGTAQFICSPENRNLNHLPSSLMLRDSDPFPDLAPDQGSVPDLAPDLDSVLDPD